MGFSPRDIRCPTTLADDDGTALNMVPTSFYYSKGGHIALVHFGPDEGGVEEGRVEEGGAEEGGAEEGGAEEGGAVEGGWSCRRKSGRGLGRERDVH